MPEVRRMSQTRVKREVNHGPGATRSVWPRAPKHTKGGDIQGFPNTRKDKKAKS